MASINLVTSHKGVNHITVDNVRDLIAGISGEISGIKIFPQLDDGLVHSITGLLQITVKTGQALAGGYHFQLTDDYNWILDDLATGYSRIDVLYLVIYQDNETFVQTADFVYVVGTAYQNGSAGVEPSAPTGTNVIETFKFMRADLTDGAIVSVTDYSTAYLSNSAVKNEFSTDIEQIQANTNALNGLRFGIDAQGRYGYKKVGADTVTPFRAPTGNATRADVLVNKSFSNDTDDGLVGTMPNIGKVTGSVNPNGSYTISKGYHDGTGKVNGNPNTGTYTFPSGSGGATVDMGVANLNRYVNAANVRNTGRNDESSHSIRVEISGSTVTGFVMDVYVDNMSQPKYSGSATGTIGEMNPGQYGANFAGSFTGYTSYNGGLHA